MLNLSRLLPVCIKYILNVGEKKTVSRFATEFNISKTYTETQNI